MLHDVTNELNTNTNTNTNNFISHQILKQFNISCNLLFDGSLLHHHHHYKTSNTWGCLFVKLSKVRDKRLYELFKHEEGKKIWKGVATKELV